jgi:RNA polymerase sigma-70 factor (family 1)
MFASKIHSLKSKKNLLLALRDGDENAFTTIYNTYWKKLLALAYANLKDKMLAEEVVQEVFISLWNRRFDQRIESLEAYLATAVKFSTFKSLHRNRRHSEIENQTETKDYYIQDDVIESKFLKEYLDGVVEKLPDKCRLVFKLSRESYLSNKEIAKDLDISEKSVEAHITRALKLLKSNLQKAGILILLIFIS